MKTNTLRHVSGRLSVRLGDRVVTVGEKLNGPTALTGHGKYHSLTFGDARIVASHELHPSDTVTSAWTVASIGLDPERIDNDRFFIRGGTNCATRMTVVTDSALTEGSLRLAAGVTGLRFSMTEGAPLAHGQTNRVDAPPDAVDARRDFWLGTAVGGLHTLSYVLRNPLGATCLTTNLTIEAIVAKFATNVYYAAYGATSGINVALSSASYDPAGYTLRLNGTLCATGQPPWQVAVSNLTAGAYTLTVRAKTFPDLVDEAVLKVVKVDYLEASSTKADNSPQQFSGHQTWPFISTNWSNPGRHLVVYFKDVVDANLNVQDFDINLAAHILPSSVSHTVLNESWRRISGPLSGILNRTDTFAVKFRNPKQGGIYKIGLDLGLADSCESEVNIVLPLAGAEVDSIIRADIVRADAFVAIVLADYTPPEIN